MSSWGKWFKDDNGDNVKFKNVSHPDGQVDQHYMRARESKQDHAHIVIRHKPDGGKTAHGAPPKLSRKPS